MFSVKSPIKKSSLGELPREAFPTDSVTSSYGVGPTDENGRPLFGLSALRRRQSTNNNIQISQGRQHLHVRYGRYVDFPVSLWME
jgi:hypothetical protein